jgi:hypothetical protein
MNMEQQKEWCYQNQLAIKELGTKALTRLESWSRQAELIERKFRLEDDIMLKRVIVSDWLKSEVQDLQSSYMRSEQVMTELQKSLDSLLEQTNLVKGNVKLAATEVTAAIERLDDCIQELSLACKRQDRAKSKLVAALSFGGLGDMAESKMKENNNGDNATKEELEQEHLPKKEGKKESLEV